MPSYFAAVDTRSLGIVAVRPDGKVFNFKTNGWDVLPTGGGPAADNIVKCVKPISEGPLAQNAFVTLPDVPSDVEGVVASIVQLDAAGKVIAQIDQWPAPYVNYMTGVRGGFSLR